MKRVSEREPHLTPEQWKEIKTHCELGKRQLDMVKGIRPEVLSIVMQHHEQPNGKGYPNNLTGNQIFHPAKIVAIADGFSALLSDRPFREAKTPKEAIESRYVDKKCPFTSSVSIRGQILKGIVISLEFIENILRSTS